MKTKLTNTMLLSLGLCMIAPCSADIIVANNAGSTLATAEDLTGSSVTEIVGTLDGVNQNDVSMFKLSLSAADFSAVTVPPGAFGIPDTVLALFNVNGVGVYLNDDISGSNTLSCLPSAIASNPCPFNRNGTGPLTDGVYYLSISRSANYPVDSSNNEIFTPVLSTDLVGPSSTDPVAGWDQNAFTSPDFDLVNYDIVLTGAVPEPATWALTAAAALIAGFLGRKRILR